MDSQNDSDAVSSKKLDVLIRAVNVQKESLSKTNELCTKALSKYKEALDTNVTKTKELMSAEQKHRALLASIEAKNKKRFKEMHFESTESLKQNQLKIVQICQSKMQHSDNFVQNVNDIIQNLRSLPSVEFDESHIYEAKQQCFTQTKSCQEQNVLLNEKYNEVRTMPQALSRQIDLESLAEIRQEMRIEKRPETEIINVVNNIKFLQNKLGVE